MKDWRAILEPLAAEAPIPPDPSSLPSRPLAPTERAALEAQGNRAENWEAIRVHPSFTPRGIWYSTFRGSCYLGLFEPSDHDLFPEGIYHSVIRHTVVCSHARIHHCPLLSSLYIDEGAEVIHTTSHTPSPFSAGLLPTISPGIETGGREITPCDVLTPDLAIALTTRPLPGGLEEAYANFLTHYRDTTLFPFSYIGPKAHVAHCSTLSSVYIGSHAAVTGSSLTHVTIHSSEEAPTLVGEHTTLQEAILQEGVHVTTGAVVRRSLLMEATGAEDHGKIEGSIVLPNTHIAKGEVTASLVGPFVGFHHQSLLIAAWWPEGKGNIAYGANVGSNHTSRQPDQEIWPGEGMFFGLGCSIKFPAHFRDAPYTTIATAVMTMPQRMEYPFSLITQPISYPSEVPTAYNQLMPGWMLTGNAYGLFRSEEKFRTRNKARRYRPEFEIFRPRILFLMDRALDRLSSIGSPRPFYLPEHLPGIGKNYVTEEDRLGALEGYRLFLEYGILRILLGLSSCEDATWHNEIQPLVEKYHLPEQREAQIPRYLELLDAVWDRIEGSRHKDAVRGRRIIDDYLTTHPEEDAVLSTLRKRFDEERNRLTH
ncbi:DUF4954 family protein [Spirochaeta thermophila]|uniref:DUF4954 domain-containing protein n=1 Tax=Winmispira thermophila (strain ATCC 49972 / DSM 6192 / RI 19.B1) TaxID=665571 RepID=E0RTX6_WINT6|nr:DUF4954 family protein [Spirochaeta thermophila]ADN01032.1 hypothetical protein STHERM_c00560 [Spirochaeta thermophila DSM 6192]